MSGGVETVVDALRRDALARPEADAVVAERRTMSRGELAARVDDCAARLASRRIVSGECVGVTIADEFAHIVVVLGLASLGAAYIVLPTFEGASARSRLAERVGARRVVAARLEHGLQDLELVPLDTVLSANPVRGLAPPPARCDASSLLTYFSTSGTTGEAKLVPILHGRLALQSTRVPAVRMMPFSSMEHHYVSRMFHCLMLQGGTMVVRGRTRTPLARLCATLGVEVVIGMPAQARTLMGEAAQHGRLPPGTMVRVAGARVSARSRREMLARLCDAFDVLYAAQECGPLAHTLERDPARVTETAGSLYPGVEIRIVDERGNELPPGEIGEIRMRAPGMATGYHDDPVATARHFRDGWFQPGDAGSFTPDGELHVYGRADDVMNLAGIKIAPLEIERVLERHPAVEAVVAFPLRSPVHGEVPVAAIKLVEGARAGARELQAFAREALGLRAPRRVKILSELPVTAQGKVDVRRLADAMKSDPD